MTNEPNWLEFFEDRERLYADYYLTFAEQNARRDAEAYERLEIESGNLLRVGNWLGEYDDEGILKLASALWEKSDFIRTRGYLQRSFSLLEKAYQAAQQIDDTQAEFIWLEALAEIQLNTGRPSAAQPLFEQAMTLADKSKNRTLQARSQLDMGRFLMEMSKLEDAITWLEQALQNYRLVQNYEGQIEAVVALGNLLSLQGDAEGAIACIEQGLPLVQARKDQQGEANLRFALGYVGTAIKDWEFAVIHYEPVINLAQFVGNRFLEIRSLTNLGEAWLELGDVEQAMSLLEKALALQEINDDILSKAFTHLYLARGCNLLGLYDESLLHLEHTHPLDHVPVLSHEAAMGAWVKADNYLKKGNPKLALFALREVLDLAPSQMFDLRQSAEILIQTLEKGDPDQLVDV